MSEKMCYECDHYGEDGYYDSIFHKDRWIPQCDRGHYERVAFDAPACEDFKEEKICVNLTKRYLRSCDES